MKIMRSITLAVLVSLGLVATASGMRAMRRLRLTPEQIRQSAFENANAFYGLRLPLPSLTDDA